MRVGVVGCGVVGKALLRLFRSSPALMVSAYDKYLPEYASLKNLLETSRAEIVFVAVPTPYDERRGECDVSVVEEVIENLNVPICIKSTVPPGTTDALASRTNKRIAFSPEYIGESLDHPWPGIDDCGFVVYGGDKVACDLVCRTYRAAARPDLRYYETTALAAELGKYMENAFLATKVAFVNQFYDLADAVGVDFEELRTMFLLDSRVGASHTKVSRERGFAGKCLPKDLQSIVAWAAQKERHARLLEAVLSFNESSRAVGT